jgi:gluconolactonase
MADDFVRPNGLAFSADEKTLYIADSARSHDPEAPHHVRAFSVGPKGKLSKGRVLCDVDPGVPDGLRLDVEGNIWISCKDGIVCVDPEGTPLGKIKVPQEVANLTFGGPKRNRLFITATTSVYSIMVTTNGIQVP